MHKEKGEEEAALTLRWIKVRNRVKADFGVRPDMNALLFLIGINEVGIVKDNWEKEEKLDLMHVAVCKLLENDGYYKRCGIDNDGWPQFEKSKTLPKFDLKEQENLLKLRMIEYFENL